MIETLLGFLEFTLIASAVLLIYFAPTLIAHKRDPLGAFSVFNVNMFLGWTGIGWLFALYLSLRPVPEDDDNSPTKE